MRSMSRKRNVPDSLQSLLMAAKLVLISPRGTVVFSCPLGSRTVMVGVSVAPVIVSVTSWLLALASFEPAAGLMPESSVTVMR